MNQLQKFKEGYVENLFTLKLFVLLVFVRRTRASCFSVYKNLNKQY